MKYILLLSALIFTMPAWAAETAATSANPQASAQAEPAAQATKKAKTRKHAKKSKKPVALSCPSGCSSAVCGGVNVCVQNKPAPLCTPC